MVHRPDLDAGVVGSQYRSEIFCTTSEQRTVAEEMIRDVDASGHLAGQDRDEGQRGGEALARPLEAPHYLARFPDGCTPPFPPRSAAVESAPAST